MSHLKFAFMCVVPAAIISAAVHFLLAYFFPDLGSYQDILYYSIFLFGILTLVIVFLGHRTVDNPSKHLFSYVTILSVFVKLAFGVLLVVLYKQKCQPPDILFVIPFFVAYIIFTVSEIAALQHIIRMSKKT